MNEITNKRAVLVGLFVLTGLVVLLAGTLFIGNIHETFKRKMRVISLFDDVNGLQKGNNVWFSGVKIGVVTALHFYGKSQVEVTFKIENKVQQYIRKDAKVKIGSDGLIGNRILIIYGGTSLFEEVQEGDTLAVDNIVSTDQMMSTLQENNVNLLAITTDFKKISHKLTTSEGSIGKLLNDETVYDNINAATGSLKNASGSLKNITQSFTGTATKADRVVDNLSEFSQGLNKKGTLSNQLITDTVVFASIKSTALQLQQIADTATVFITNLKDAGKNPKSSIGVLLYDEEAGANVKQTLKTLESGSKKLEEDLEGLQHSFPLKRYFKKKAKLKNADLKLKQ
jgi:phospholipid/cholesterol/gamma-HCH transport system substrate-binding protein